MTGIAGYAQGQQGSTRAGQLVAAVLIGALAGGVATFVATRPQAADIGMGAGTAAGRVDVSTTSAGKQYADWYTRPSVMTGPTTSAGKQYADWYTRGAGTSGSTSAGDQYQSWYTRPSNAAGSTDASGQYRSWYLRAEQGS
jgi:hypothetical protein